MMIVVLQVVSELTNHLRCFPDDDMWQLLGKPYSFEKFLKLPMLSQAFFEHQLKISSRLSAIRKAKNGTCVISIKRMDSVNVFLNHSFEMIDSESPDQVMDLDFKNLVAVVFSLKSMLTVSGPRIVTIPVTAETNFIPNRDVT
jgi:hypothetical protein